MEKETTGQPKGDTPSHPAGDEELIPCDNTKAGRKLLKSQEAAIGLACIIAHKWNFGKFLSIDEIKEEAERVLGVFELLEIRPWMSIYRSLIQARLYRRMKEKGYRILNAYSAGKVGQKAGIRLIEIQEKDVDDLDIYRKMWEEERDEL